MTIVSKALDLRPEALGRPRTGQAPSRITAPPVSHLVPMAALILGCGLTALSFQSWVGLAHRLPRMHAVLDTTIGLVALLVAYLVFGRVRAFGRRRDFVLAFGLGFGALVNLFAAVAQGVSSAPHGPFLVWTTTIGRLIVALLFAAAALTPATRRVPRAPVPFLFGLAIAFIGLTVAVAMVSAFLPWSADLANSPTDASKPLLVGPSLLVLAEAIVPVAYSIAGWRFIRTRDEGDELMTWLASSCMLFALSGLDYLAFPSIFSDWIYVGDILRLAGVSLLLVGAAREIRGYWRRSAATEERKRIAGDLHDGIAQELAFIATIARRLEHDTGGRDARRLANAAQHALDESRLAISTLFGAGNVAEQLALTARDAAHRFDLDPVLDIPEALDLPSEVVEGLLRIVRESINNAGQHAQATTIWVHVARTAHGIVLQVEDDGIGFDPSLRGAGFGLTSMRERAEAVGGALTVTSVPRAGTMIRVEVAS